MKESDRPVLYYTYLVARKALEELSAAGHNPDNPEDARYGAMMGWTMLHGFSSLLLSGNLQPAEGMDRDRLKELFLRFYTRGDLSHEDNALIDTGPRGGDFSPSRRL